MSIQPTAEDVLQQLSRVSSDLASLSYTLGVFSGTFEYATEPTYSYLTNQVVESCTDLHENIASLISKMKANER